MISTSLLGTLGKSLEHIKRSDTGKGLIQVGPGKTSSLSVFLHKTPQTMTCPGWGWWQCPGLCPEMVRRSHASVWRLWWVWSWWLGHESHRMTSCGVDCGEGANDTFWEVLVSHKIPEVVMQHRWRSSTVTPPLPCPPELLCRLRGLKRPVLRVLSSFLQQTKK